MNTDYLHYFCVLGKTLNYTAAAEQCFITRQALRQAVQTLEKQFQTQLIVNEHNRLNLTPAGKELMEHSETVLRDCQTLETAMERHYRKVQETLHIGICSSLYPYYWPQATHAFERFSEEAPNIYLVIEMKSAEEIIRDIQKNKTDAAVLMDDGKTNLPGKRHVMKTDSMAVSVAPSHFLAKRQRLQIRDLDGMNLYLMASPEVCFSQLLEAAEKSGIRTAFSVDPNYFSVTQKIMRSNSGIIDRTENIDDNISSTFVSVPLEGFNIYTVLLYSADPSKKPLIRLLRFLQTDTKKL